MRTLEREHADALLDARPVRRVPEVSDAPAEDDDTTFSAFIGMLVGVAVSLPLWAALTVAVILILR
jgi:hypothetical protein